MGWKKLLGDIKEKYDQYAENRKIENERRAQIQKDNEKKRLQYEESVNKLLDKFQIFDFDTFLIGYLNKKPESEIEIDEETGKEHINKPSRKKYLDFVWGHLNNDEINLQQLKDFALKKKIVSPSFFGEETDVEVEKREFNELINAIKSDFEPEKITDEEHLQAQLFIFLKTRFPDKKMSRETRTKIGDEIDIVVDDKYAFEVKVPDDRTILRNLSAQLEEYAQDYPNLCAVILDIEGKNMTPTINDYTDKYKRDYGVRSVVLKGRKSNSKS